MSPQDIEEDLCDSSFKSITSDQDGRPSVRSRSSSRGAGHRSSQCTTWRSGTRHHPPQRRKRQFFVPIHQTVFALGYPPPYSVASPGTGIWRVQAHQDRTDSAGSTPRKAMSDCQDQRQGRASPGRAASDTCTIGDGFSYTGESGFSEECIQRWLPMTSRPKLMKVDGISAARVRAGGVANWQMEWRRAQTTVATHVE